MESESHMSGGQALSLLVVDDSPVMRSFIRRVLSLADLPEHQVHEAGDGESALSVLGNQHIDLVLSDINMPRMNGTELIRRMRAVPQFCQIPVIVVSTDSSQLRVESMMELGASGYLSKPFHPERLRAEIERVLEL